MALIDPATRDYVADSFDAALVAPLIDAAALRLRTRRGSWWRNPLLGSRFYLLKKDTPQALVLAKQYAEEALKPLITSKRVTSMTITPTRVAVGSIRILVELLTPSGASVQLEHFVRVGG
jgi:phage gp46-like protein